MLEWFENHEALTWWLTAGSLVMFVATLVAVPVAVVRIPADYFVRDEHQQQVTVAHPLLRVCWRICKMVLGILLVAAGVLMLVLPGQGVITILIGVMFLNFPGRRRLQYWIASRRQVLSSMNWLRRRAGREPFRMHSSA